MFLQLAPFLILFRVVSIKPTVLSRSSQCYSSGRSFCWKKCKSKIKERNQTIYQNREEKTLPEPHSSAVIFVKKNFGVATTVTAVHGKQNL